MTGTASSWTTASLRDSQFDVRWVGDEARVRSLHRLHLFSLDLSADGKERAGGAGISIPNLPIDVGVRILHSATHDEVPTHLVDDLEPVLNGVRRTCKSEAWFSVEIYSRLIRHCGLGSTTQIKGLVAIAAAAVLGVRLTPIDLAALEILDAGSCVGLTLMSRPGFVLDLGFEVRSSSVNEEFVPHRRVQGHFRRPQGISLRLESPPPWHVLVAITDEAGLSGDEELAFWSARLPTDHTAAADSTYYVLMDLIPGLVTRDLERVLRSLNAISHLHTKVDELQIQSRDTRQALSVLRDQFGFSGLSSLGPSIYTLTHQPLSTLDITHLSARLPKKTELLQFQLDDTSQLRAGD